MSIFITKKVKSGFSPRVKKYTFCLYRQILSKYSINENINKLGEKTCLKIRRLYL